MHHHFTTLHHTQHRLPHHIIPTTLLTSPVHHVTSPHLLQ
ncbi:hypothetical protein E2C01_047822 [Portunus trituberculatus]|uniref:Uncharacterized protein n=1 Tax=Portunus trituberculatus TaxID=210409 RepID=A0A5B7G8I3_PORTR|nr:hypothetical protein [Portunus trituberculatus]